MQIYDFAVKWCDKFRNQNINCIELIDHSMTDDCVALGFDMDSGNAFSEKYGDAISNPMALDRIIDDVTDIQLLGSAIYSQWHYFNHLANASVEILEPKNRAWFILALSRLALLSGDNPFIFQGKLKKMRIISNNICYGPMPKPDEEVEQHITINNEGNVWFSGYNFGHSGENYPKARSMNFKIDKYATDEMFSCIEAYFSDEYTEIFATDIGNWEMELTNTDDVTYKFSGSLCSNFNYEGVDLSDLIRDTVGIDTLYVFDGNLKPNVINKITIDYCRHKKIKPVQKPEFITGEWTERLIIDRKTETLDYIRNLGLGFKISHKYEFLGGVSSFFATFNENDLFTNIVGNHDDVIDTPNETKDYVITIEYKNNPSRTVTGSYDKNGLPEDFANFIENLFDLISYYGVGEIFDPSIYGKTKRRKSEYIYCSVIFDEGNKGYYYLTDDDSIEIDDFVLVPVGKDNYVTVAKVVNVEYFSEKSVPLPVAKTKRIIRKCKDDDFELSEL